MKNLFQTILMIALVVMTLGSCQQENIAPNTPGTDQPTPPGEEPSGEDPTGEDPENTPFTSIPDELVGTWFASDNENPLTINWEEGTFQGEVGFKEFRTMVFTKDGKNAVEYYAEAFASGTNVLFKRVGTLEYKENPRSLTFHVQSGKVRVFSAGSASYQESDLISEEWPTYYSVLVDPEATTYSSSTNYLMAKRSNGATEYSVKYTKVEDNIPDEGTPDPDDLYTTPPATGTYVEIAGKYYPTVNIGEQEWMSVNYAGTGGMHDSSKPHYGTFYKYMDLQEIPIPEGWRMPTKQDYIHLLKSQGLVLNAWESTNGEDLQSKKLLGQLMATTDWLKQDGYATNQSGFNAMPSNYRVQDANLHGEGTNCYLWTADVNEDEAPIVFQIIQLPSDTYASFTTFPLGYFPQHLPLRLVKDK